MLRCGMRLPTKSKNIISFGRGGWFWTIPHLGSPRVRPVESHIGKRMIICSDAEKIREWATEVDAVVGMSIDTSTFQIVEI